MDQIQGSAGDYGLSAGALMLLWFVLSRIVAPLVQSYLPKPAAAIVSQGAAIQQGADRLANELSLLGGKIDNMVQRFDRHETEIKRENELIRNRLHEHSNIIMRHTADVEITMDRLEEVEKKASRNAEKIAGLEGKVNK